MTRKTLIVMGVGLLAATAAPARADLQGIFEPFNDSIAARTFHVQEEGGKKSTFLIGGEYQMFDTPFFGSSVLETQIYRGGIGFATQRLQIGVAAGNENLELGGADTDNFVIEAMIKYLVWSSANRRTNVSIAGAWRDIEDDYTRWDALVAVDHQFGRDVIGTINAGYVNSDIDGAKDANHDFAGAVGVTINPAKMRRWFLSLEYLFESEGNLFAKSPQGGNWFSAKLTYRAGKRLDVFVGGGEDERVIGGARIRL